MSILFGGGQWFQRGIGIRGLLRLAKGLFKPLIESIGESMRSYTGQAIGNAFMDQAINSAKNLATDVLTGNPLKEGVKREAQNIRNRAILGIQQLINKEEVNYPNGRSKEVETSKPQSKRKGKTKQKAKKGGEKWVWFDKPSNK